MRDLFKFILPYWKNGFLPVFFMIISTSISFIYPMFPKWIDNVITTKEYNRLLFYTIMFLIAVLMQNLFEYFSEVSFFKFQKQSLLNIQNKIINRIFNLPIDFFTENHSGYISGKIRGDVDGFSFVFSNSLVTFLLSIFQFLSVFLIIAFLNLKLTLLTMSVFPFVFIKILYSRESINKINEKILTENANLNKELSDIFQGIELFKSFSVESLGITRSLNALKIFQIEEKRRKKILTKYRSFVNTFFNIGSVLLLFFGIKEIISGKLTLGNFMAFYGYLGIVVLTNETTIRC